MDFWRAKHGLRKIGDLKTKIGLILGRRTKREEEKEEEKKRKRRSSKPRYGTNLGYEFYYGSYGFCMEL